MAECWIVLQPISPSPQTRARGLEPPNPVPWDEPQVCSVLEEDVAGGLLGVDPDAVIRDDRAETGRSDWEAS